MKISAKELEFQQHSGLQRRGYRKNTDVLPMVVHVCAQIDANPSDGPMGLVFEPEFEAESIACQGLSRHVFVFMCYIE